MNKMKALLGGLFLASNGLILFGLMILLLIASLFFQRNKMQKEMDMKIQYIEEKNILRDELDDLIDEHDGLLNEYGYLNNQLYAKDSIIQSQITEIRSLIRTKNDLKQAREKIESLKDIAKRYLANIDSLLSTNKQLTIEKDSVIKANKNINWKNYKLNKENEKLAEKVSKGTVLEILNIDVTGLRYRGTGKEVSTRKAKKLQKIRICFTIGANQISDPEKKIVFIQFIDPNGELVKGKENIQVNVADSIFDCTTFSEFNYQNVEIEECFEWERVQQLEKGNYLINLIIEGRVSGQQKFKLK